MNLEKKPLCDLTLEEVHQLIRKQIGCGICVICGEWTEVGRSCCGHGVVFDGGVVKDEEGEDDDS